MKNVRTMWVVPFRDKTLTGLVAVVLFLCDCPALGVLEFKDGLTHDIDYSTSDDVWVDWQAPSMYTTVNWLDGASCYNLQGFEDSRINMTGGSIDWDLYAHGTSQVDISGGLICRGLDAYGSSQVAMSGGLIGRGLYAHGTSQVDISGGAILWLVAYDSSQVHVSDGLIGQDLYAQGSSQVAISGGAIDHRLFAHESSQVDISGGAIGGSLNADDSSQVDMSGGSIDGDLWASGSSLLTLHGSEDFAVDGQQFGYGELTSILGGYCGDEPYRHLSGMLDSGELIDNGFRIGYNARIVLIPEPASAMMLGLGSVFFALRRMRR